MTERTNLADVTADVVVCRACPRLVAWRELVARDKVARFAAEPYWARPVPGFGDRLVRAGYEHSTRFANSSSMSGRR